MDIRYWDQVMQLFFIQKEQSFVCSYMNNDVIDLSSTQVMLFKPVPNLCLTYRISLRPHLIDEVELNKKFSLYNLAYVSKYLNQTRHKLGLINYT